MARILMQGTGIGSVPRVYLKLLPVEFKIKKCQPTLMLMENGRKDEIRDDFVSYEVEEILRASIGNQHNRDVRIWKHNPKGIYTVSSGYMKRAETMAKRKNREVPSYSLGECDWWKKIWNLKTPTKVRIFWWQTSLDFIPAEANLMRHHVTILPSCRLCGFSNASTIHVIFYCPWVREVWREAGVLLLKEPDLRGETIDFLEGILQNNTHTKGEMIVALAWGIWKKRCEIIHSSDINKKGNLKITLSKVHWAIAMIEEYERLRYEMDFKEKKNPLTFFNSEDQDTLVVFTDTSYLHGDDSSSFGVIILDGNGELMDVFKGSLGPMESPLDAELTTIAQGMSRAKGKRRKRILMLSDCKEAIAAVNDNEKLLNRSGYMLNWIK